MMERQSYTVLSKNFPDFMKCVIKPENKIGSVNFQNPYFLIRLLSFIIIIICGSSSNTLDIANIFPLWYLSLSLECFIIQIYKFWSNQIHLSFFLSHGYDIGVLLFPTLRSQRYRLHFVLLILWLYFYIQVINYLACTSWYEVKQGSSFISQLP